MSKESLMTRAQMEFLRACRLHPNGVPPEAFPSPPVFRRWMRRASFRTALYSLRDALRVQADIHLASAATEAAKTLQRSLETSESLADSAEQRGLLHTLVQLLRLSHMRQRYQVDPAPPPVYSQKEDILESLRLLHPNASVGFALEMLQSDSLEEAGTRYKARLEREGHSANEASNVAK